MKAEVVVVALVTLTCCVCVSVCASVVLGRHKGQGVEIYFLFFGGCVLQPCWGCLWGNMHVHVKGAVTQTWVFACLWSCMAADILLKLEHSVPKLDCVPGLILADQCLVPGGLTWNRPRHLGHRSCAFNTVVSNKDVSSLPGSR